MMIEKTNANLFYADGETEGAPGLKGSRCKACGAMALLAVPVCPLCLSRDVMPACIGQRATLTRFSTVHHSVDGFDAPYVIGEVKTAEGPSTFAPIIGEPASMKQGMRLRFALLPRGEQMGFTYVAESA